MTDLEKNEIQKAKLRKAYLEAGADWVIYDLEGIKKVIDKIVLYKINKN
jgi:hypothetical protein